jgi:peptidyl-prolyl cis-trans isomerase D
MLRRQILDALTGGTKTPQPLLDAVHQYQSESRDLRYVVLDAQAIPPVTDPDDKVLNSFFAAHRSEFRTAERRSIVALPVSTDILAPRQQVSEAEIAADYDRERSKFTTPEKRTVERITFKTMDEAKAAAAKIAAGTSFADLAKARSLKPQDISLGTVTKSGLIDTAIADAAFTLPDGGVSKPVQGQFSPTLVHVTKIEPARTKPLADVKDQVRQEVADAKARKVLNDLHNTIEDDRAGGATLAEIATKRGLKLVKIDDVDAQGLLRDGMKAPGPGLTPLLAAAFKTEANADNDPVRLDDTGYIWYNVTKIDPAHPRTLADARKDVVAAWRADETRQRLAAKSQDLVKALRAGKTTLEKVATDAKSTIAEAIGLTRVGGAPPKGFGPAAVPVVFATAKDGYGVADAATAPERVIFQVTKVDVPKSDPDSPLSKEIASRLDKALQNDLATEYVLDLQNAYGVRVNQSVLAQVTGVNPGSE